MAILYGVFSQVVRMSLAASAVIAVVCVLRLCLKRAPKKFSCLLWLAVGFRLACPVSFSSVFSLFSLSTALKSQSGRLVYSGQAAILPAPAKTTAPGAASGAPQASNTLGALPAADSTRMPGPAGTPDLGAVLALLWILGVLILLGYAVYACLRTRRRVAAAVRLYGNVYECDSIPAPFVLGLFRPRIYLPFGLSGAEKDYLLCHESTHIRRGDHLVKPLFFLLLAAHWFNPLVWLAFSLLTRDMEMSCDEAVLQKLGDDVKKPYTLSLLAFAQNRRFPSPNPLCFGETGVKERIKNALRFQRARAWVTAGAAILCVLAITACTANPAQSSPPAVGVLDSDDAFAVQAKGLLTSAFTCPDAYFAEHWKPYPTVSDSTRFSAVELAEAAQAQKEAMEAEEKIFQHHQERFPAECFASQSVQDNFIAKLAACGFDSACLAGGGTVTVLDIVEERGSGSLRTFSVVLDVSSGGEKNGERVELAVRFQEKDGKIAGVQFDEEVCSDVVSRLTGHDPNYDGDGAYLTADVQLSGMEEYIRLLEAQISRLKATDDPDKDEKLAGLEQLMMNARQELEEFQQMLALAQSTWSAPESGDILIDQNSLGENAVVVDDYIRGAKLGGGFLKSGNPSYAIGINTHNLPIFRDMDSAFKQAKLDYAEGFQAIAEEFGLEPVNAENWMDYKLCGWQLSTEDEAVALQGREITGFFDLFENGYPDNYEDSGMTVPIQYPCGSLPEVYVQSLNAFTSSYWYGGVSKVLLDLTDIPDLSDRQRQEIADALAELWELEVELIDAKETYGTDYTEKNLGFPNSTVLLLCNNWKKTGGGFQFNPMELTGSRDSSTSDPYTVQQSGKSFLVTPGSGMSYSFVN